MTRDPSVILLGEDIVGGAGADGETDAWGGVLGVTKGLYAKHGDRLLDTPLSESAYVGAAIGAAACGMRPVAELMFIDFMGVCFDQIFNQAAKFRYMFGGKAETPVVIRAMVGAGFRAAAQHSQMLTPLFTHIPGLKVVCPATPYDTKGLLIQAIRDNDPVIFCEHKNLYGFEGEVPEARTRSRSARRTSCATASDVLDRHLRPDGASRARSGRDAREGRHRGAKWSTCARSRRSTSTRCSRASRTPAGSSCVDEASPRCNIATDISAQVAQQAFGALKAADRDGRAAAHAGAVLADARGPATSRAPRRSPTRRASTLKGGKH